MLALRELRRNVLRSFLTILGIVIGVASVIIMVTLGSGATVQVSQQIASLGSNVVILVPGMGPGRGSGAVPFDDSDAEAIARDVGDLKAIAPAPGCATVGAPAGPQTARIGVATADLYPKFTLPGTIGLEALAANNLFSAANRAWSLARTFAWPVFQGGPIRQNIEVQNALQEQALNQYEATILIALEEVENSLVAYAEEQERRDTLAAATEAAQRSAELAQDQHTSGLIDFQAVLDSQRSVRTFQDQPAQSKGQVTINLISLYKALGGEAGIRQLQSRPNPHSWDHASLPLIRRSYRREKPRSPQRSDSFKRYFDC